MSLLIKLYRMEATSSELLNLLVLDCLASLWS